MRNKTRSEQRHHQPGENVGVKCSADDTNDLPRPQPECGVLGDRWMRRREVEPRLNDRDDREDRHEFREEPITNGAEPMIAPRLIRWCCHSYLTVKGTVYSRSSHEKRIRPPLP